MVWCWLVFVVLRGNHPPPLSAPPSPSLSFLLLLLTSGAAEQRSSRCPVASVAGWCGTHHFLKTKFHVARIHTERPLNFYF